MTSLKFECASDAGHFPDEGHRAPAVRRGKAAMSVLAHNIIQWEKNKMAEALLRRNSPNPLRIAFVVILQGTLDCPRLAFYAVSRTTQIANGTRSCSRGEQSSTELRHRQQLWVHGIELCVGFPGCTIPKSRSLCKTGC